MIEFCVDARMNRWEFCLRNNNPRAVYVSVREEDHPARPFRPWKIWTLQVGTLIAQLIRRR